MALEAVCHDPCVEVVGLLTTITDAYARVSMHGIREALVEAQARSLNLPLFKVYLPPQCSNRDYEQRMHATCLQLRNAQVEAIVFGDLFLEDVRQYRGENLKTVGMKAIFPLWHFPTRELALQCIAKGYRAKVVVVDLDRLSASFVGREYDLSFLNDLPDGIDPCGENGEFHTFVYGGPMFQEAITCRVGKQVVRDGRFCFIDLLP